MERFQRSATIIRADNYQKIKEKDQPDLVPRPFPVFLLPLVRFLGSMMTSCLNSCFTDNVPNASISSFSIQRVPLERRDIRRIEPDQLSKACGFPFRTAFTGSRQPCGLPLSQCVRGGSQPFRVDRYLLFHYGSHPFPRAQQAFTCCADLDSGSAPFFGWSEPYSRQTCIYAFIVRPSSASKLLQHVSW